MAEKQWEPQKIQFCERAGSEVALEVELVFPADFLSDQPARLIGKRCSRGLECNLFNQPTCVWSGTNPMLDPFQK